MKTKLILTTLLAAFFFSFFTPAQGQIFQKGDKTKTEKVKKAKKRKESKKGDQVAEVSDPVTATLTARPVVIAKALRQSNTQVWEVLEEGIFVAGPNMDDSSYVAQLFLPGEVGKDSICKLLRVDYWAVPRQVYTPKAAKEVAEVKEKKVAAVVARDSVAKAQEVNAEKPATVKAKAPAGFRIVKGTTLVGQFTCVTFQDNPSDETLGLVEVAWNKLRTELAGGQTIALQWKGPSRTANKNGVTLEWWNKATVVALDPATNTWGSPRVLQ